MSLQPTLDTGVPSQTASVAHAAFPRGHAYLSLRDALGPISADAQFVELFAHDGQPAACPWRLALVTVLQFAENLSDRRAADAVRARIDWKYLLGLALTDPGFDASVLSEFRSRLVAGAAEGLLFDTLLNLCRERGLLAKRGRQRTDATHVLEAVRSLNRLGCAIETLRTALNVLAIAAPGWLRDVPAVTILRGAWLQNFRLAERDAGGPHGGDRARWRTEADGIPPALTMVASPYDPDVHDAKKRATTWIGYKVHVTWADLAADLVVRKATTKTGAFAAHDLKLCPPGGRAARRVPVDRRVGPLILDEIAGRPFAESAYGREWRLFAKAAGVPDHVWDMDARPGAFTEAEDAGADLAHIRSAAAHAQTSTTQRYSRGAVGKSRAVANLRIAHRAVKNGA